MRIDRCLCFGRTFVELKEVADRTGSETIVELQDHVRFGLNCRLCHPYVRVMLKTGQTVFDYLITDDDQSIQG
jgi:bacterioferritin-associated ferredoxin